MTQKNESLLYVGQEVEIIKFGKIVHGVIHAILTTGPRNVKVKTRSAYNMQGYSIVAKTEEYVYPRGTLKGMNLKND